MKDHVLKHGIGYDLVIAEKGSKLHLGIRCHTCQRVSFHPKDIKERYCGACAKFHETNLFSHEG